MNKTEYFKFHDECMKQMGEVTRRKNADYTGNGTDPFANFTRVEALGVCSTEQGFLTRMTDKMSRLASLVAQGNAAQVKDESVKDTLLDLANYCVLLAGYLESKRPSPPDHVVGPFKGECPGCVIEEEQRRKNDWIAP